jgi:hypothetical protein
MWPVISGTWRNAHEQVCRLSAMRIHLFPARNVQHRIAQTNAFGVHLTMFYRCESDLHSYSIAVFHKRRERSGIRIKPN